MPADEPAPMADLTVMAAGPSFEKPMHVMLRLSLVPGWLLLAGLPPAMAETPLPDPVAPAVIGRPLDQIGPGRRVRDKPAAATPAPSRRNHVQPTAGGAPPRAPQQALGAGAEQDTPGAPRRAKQALDDRADPRMRLDEVGSGTRLARKPLGPGAYFGDRHRSAVRKSYQASPATGAVVHWEVGAPVPAGARLKAVPRQWLAGLPELPPGHRYVRLGDELVLIAAGSRIVVDGISRNGR